MGSYHRGWLLAIAISLVGGIAVPAAAAEGPAITGVALEPASPRQYERLEVTFALLRTYDNPFDPRQIDVTAHITTPAGPKQIVPAFPYQEFRQVTGAKGEERLEPEGGPVWKVRYAPAAAGRYRLRLHARDKEGETVGEEVTFTVAARRADGYVRRSSRDPRFLAFESGRPYFALGENVCWSGQARPVGDYDTWFRHLQQAGCNYARLWLAGPFISTAPIHCPQEPTEVGPGRYSQRSSWRLDQVMGMAEARGLYLLMCLDSFNSLRVSDPYPAFQQYPLNAKLGGPLESPDDFFTSPAARDEFRQRLRYYVARWGYSTNTMAWEFWNEVDIIEHYDSDLSTAWHREMARYLRSIDPAKHLITTSFARNQGDPRVDALPEMDIVQTHCYGAADPAEVLRGWGEGKRERFGKPHLVGEFGVGDAPSLQGRNREGWFIHDGMWATALSGDMGMAMTWWWDSEVEPGNFYRHFAALARFLRGTDWLGGRWQPARVTGPELLPGEPVRYTDLELAPHVASWEPNPANRPQTFTVARSGDIGGMARLSRLQHGLRNHPDLHNPATFKLDYPVDGAFEVVVAGVSGWGGANLRVSLDGRQVLAEDFPDADEGTATMDQYSRAYGVPVTPGKHEIVVENTGSDWFYVSYRLTSYLTGPPVRVLGLTGRHGALLWLQNTAASLAYGRTVEGKGAGRTRFTVSGLADGPYRVEWWDTMAGTPVSSEECRARGGRVALSAPPIERDLACKLLAVR